MQTASTVNNTWTHTVGLAALFLLTPPLHAAFLPPSFTGANEPNWNLIGDAKLTAAPIVAIDPAGQGWLRLTENEEGQVGEALYNRSFSSTDGVVITFDYVIWNQSDRGRFGDGISVFLYDPLIPSLMDAATNGAGLGYCNGAAGIIGIGIDTSEGNFARQSPISEPSYCKTGLTEISPNSITIRGPYALDNGIIGQPFELGESIGDRLATSRPTETRSVQLSVIPLPGMVGYHITLFEGPTGGELTRHLVGDYTGALPEQLSIGLAGSTGDATQVNEVRMLHVTKPIDVSVTTTAPILNGRTASHTITLQNKQLDEGEAIPITKESDAPLLSQTTDPNLTNIRWTCVAAGEGTTCPRPSGTGPFENLGSYLLGRSGTLTFTVTGTVACGANSVQVHSATAVFPPESEYDDAYPLDNYDTASGLITTDNCETPPPTATAVPFLDHLALVLLGLMAAGLGAIGLRRRSTQSMR